MVSSSHLEVINCIGFNQTGSCISVGTSKGYAIVGCEPYRKLCADQVGDLSIVEMLYSTSILIIVGAGGDYSSSPRILQVLNLNTKSSICQLSYSSSILSVRLNNKRLVVALKSSFYIYNVTNMKLLYKITKIYNPKGLLSITSSTKGQYLAYPSHSLKSNVKNPVMESLNDNAVPEATSLRAVNSEDFQMAGNGDVVIFDLFKLQPTIVIEAHKRPISAILLSSDGKLLATASELGTLIRIFDTTNGQRLYQFRRGTYPSKIASMCFTEDCKFLAVLSVRNTVHVFHLTNNSTSSPSSSELNKSSEEQEEDVNTLGKNFESSYEHSQAASKDASSSNLISMGSGTPIEPSYTDDDDFEHDFVILDDTDKMHLYNYQKETLASAFKASSKKLSREAGKQISSLFSSNQNSKNFAESSEKAKRHFAYCKLPRDIKYLNQASIFIDKEVDVSEEEYAALLPGSSYSMQAVDNAVKMVPLRVVSADGYLYKYLFDPVEGGECKLLSQFFLMDK